MSDSDRHDRLQKLVDAAFDLPDEERRRFLTTACGSDVSLRSEAERLIAALDAEARSEFLEAPLAARARTLIDAAVQDREHASDSTPERVGPYRIQQEIGRGGMGAVYLAERADGDFEQRVAVKVIKRGMDTDEVNRRFMTERRILAALQHPNVARLYDGGVTDDGRPFYVMEHVEGVPITNYCDEHRLTIDERLRLFMQVCEAVRYAQQNLVVHRDLKPSNILVTTAGRVKLLDFGIAKILSDGEGDRTLTQARVLTPLYAAPEQIEGGPITTATDVYALGVVLYELLAGHRPYGGAGGTPNTRHDIDPPSTASTRIQTIKLPDEDKTLTLDPEKVSALRRTIPGRLRRRLRGDLDTIVLSALRREPTRRYASADAFLEDIKRHLAARPIRARRDSRLYRLQKFVTRHRAGVAMAGASILIAVGAVLFHISRIDQERDQAVAETEKATALSDYLVGLFRSADPFDVEQARSDTMSIGQLLSLGADRIESDFADQPDVQHTLDHTVGQIFSSIGDLDRAEVHLSRALSSKERLYGENHPEIIGTLSEIGYIKFLRGQLVAAKTYQQKALGLSRRVVQESGVNREDATEEFLQVVLKLTATLSGSRDFPSAEELVSESLQMSREILGDRHPITIKVLIQKASVEIGQMRDVVARRTYSEAVSLADDVFGPTHPQTALAKSGYLFALAWLPADSVRGVFDTLSNDVLEAVGHLTETGQDQNDTVAATLNNLSAAYWYMGRGDSALELLRRAVRIVESIYGRTSLGYLAGMYNLANLLSGLGWSEESEEVLIDGLTAFRQFEGDNPQAVGDGFFKVASNLYKNRPLPDTIRALGAEYFTFELSVDMRAPIASGLIQRDHRIGYYHDRGYYIFPVYMTDEDGDSIYVAQQTQLAKSGFSLEYFFYAEPPSGRKLIESIRLPDRITRRLTFGDSLEIPTASWSCPDTSQCQTGTVALQVDVRNVEAFDRIPRDVFVGVRGEPFPLTWSRSIPLQDSDGDGIYAGVVEFRQVPGTEIVYQFVLDMPSRDSVRWEYEPDLSDAWRMIDGRESAERRRRFVFAGDMSVDPVEFGRDAPPHP